MAGQVEQAQPKENLRLKSQVAVVTGAASGIGRAIAIRFAQEGAKVAIFDINEKEAKKIAQEIGDQALAIKTDVRDPEQVASAVKETIKRFGQINILVNNAGIALPLSEGIFNKKAKKAWEEVISTNLNGPFYVTEAIVKKMVENNWKGNIINITSVHSRVPARRGAYYTASKAGLAAATKSWALELAFHGIRVNAIAPGAIMNTEMNKNITPENDQQRAKELEIPLGRHGQPEEIAEAAVFLATHEYITGQEIFIDGGFILTH